MDYEIQNLEHFNIDTEKILINSIKTEIKNGSVEDAFDYLKILIAIHPKSANDWSEFNDWSELIFQLIYKAKREQNEVTLIKILIFLLENILIPYTDTVDKTNIEKNVFKLMSNEIADFINDYMRDSQAKLHDKELLELHNKACKINSIKFNLAPLRIELIKKNIKLFIREKAHILTKVQDATLEYRLHIPGLTEIQFFDKTILKEHFADNYFEEGFESTAANSMSPQLPFREEEIDGIKIQLFQCKGFIKIKIS